MRSLRRLHALVAFALTLPPALVLGGPAPARACACCDGGGTRALVGWSASGRSALVEHQSWAGCEFRHTYEVWRPSSRSSPTHCFDFHAADPDAVSSCELDQLTSSFEAEELGRTARAPTRTRFYPKPGRALRPEAVRASLTRVGPREDAPCDDPHLLTVALRAAPSEPLLRTGVCLGAPDDVAGELAEGEWMVNAIDVLVFPAPAGERALVFWSGHDAAWGIGDFDTSAKMVRLPTAFRDAATLSALLQPVGGRSIASPLPAPGPRADPATRRFANRANRAGLAAHRAGDYGRARNLFSEAIWRDNGHVHAWYNLACAESRLGNVDEAIDILRIVAEWDCPRCAERIRRAATDPDLAPLLADPEVRRLLTTP